MRVPPGQIIMATRRSSLFRARQLTLAAALPVALVTGCAESTDQDSPASDPSQEQASGSESPAASDASEVATAEPRLVMTYDGGLLVVGARTLGTVSDLSLEGYNRLNPAGDGRHVLISTAGGFAALDAGVWSEEHGDHDHYYAGEPHLHEVVVEAELPGHVIAHDGRTALFDDGTGEVDILDAEELAEGDVDTREVEAPAPHHGVAVELEDGSVVVSEGTEESVIGALLLSPDGVEIAATRQCPGLHGATVAADDVVVAGCEDGVLVVKDDTITKIDAPHQYGRIGNQAGSTQSPVVLGDYETGSPQERETPRQISLIDTTTGRIDLVDLPASYTFRSLARGENGEALVLGTDGALHVIDPKSGELVRSTPVIEPWSEPEDWQETRPSIASLNGTAYITDPASQSLHAVDIETGEVWETVELPVVPDELTGVSG